MRNPRKPPPESVVTTILPASDMGTVRELFMEYQIFLNVDLCFQDFEAELRQLPGNYSPPGGALLLAHVDDEAAGCIGLRPFDGKVCEMKRLFVRPAFRSRGIGRSLAEAVTAIATDAGYHAMRLDTLSFLESAVTLYKSMGFYEIAPYCHNPLDKVMYWEKLLR